MLRASREHATLLITLVIGGAIAAFFTNLAGEIYEAVVERDEIATLDQPVLEWMVARRSPGMDTWLTAFTDVGGKVGMPILATVAALGLALWWRRRTPVVLMLGAAAGSLLITVTGKSLTGIARPPADLAVPPLETSASFPSGHTLNATVIIGLLAYLLISRYWTNRAVCVAILSLALTFIIAMGISRVYLGHHWLSDVVAAWMIGLGWLAAVITAHRVMVGLGRVASLTGS